MCGLVAIGGQIRDTKLLDAFNTMLHLSTLRGEDSTGVASVNNQNEYDIFKALGPAINHIGYKKYNQVVSTWNSLLLGHNRKATMGKISVNNAHPFVFSNCIGMHNGTLGYQEKNKLEGPNHNFDTDSEALIHALNKNDNNWFDYKIEGAWAVIWFDFVKRKLHIARNEERALWYALTKDNKNVFIASEALTITYASWRAGVPVSAVKPLEAFTQQSFHIPTSDKEEIIVLPEKIKLPGYTSKEEKEAIEKKKTQEEEERKKNWKNHFGYEEHYPTYQRNFLPKPAKENLKNTGMFYDPIGAPIAWKEFKETTNNGKCCMCSSVITSGENYKWLNKTEVLCSSCVEEVKEGLKGKHNEIHQIVKEAFPDFVFSLDEIEPKNKILVM